MKKIYPGLGDDSHGLTPTGRMVLDARVFGLIGDAEDCAGWELGRIQALMSRVEQEWDRHGGLPSALPPDLAERHRRIYDQAIRVAGTRGWNPELDDEEH
jgi:hypothetical protein